MYPGCLWFLSSLVEKGEDVVDLGLQWRLMGKILEHWVSNKLKQLNLVWVNELLIVQLPQNMVWVPGQAVCHGALRDTAFPINRGSLSFAFREGASWKDIQSHGRGWQAMPLRMLPVLETIRSKESQMRFLLWSQALCGIQDCSTTKGRKSVSLKWKQASLPFCFWGRGDTTRETTTS